MSNNKRERQRAHRQAQADATQQAQKSSRRTKIVVRWVAIAAAVVIVAFLWSLTGNDAGTGDAEEAARLEAERLEIEGCPAADGSSFRRIQWDRPPNLCIDTGQLHSAEFATNLGDFAIVLDPTLDSRSVNNFIFLARNHAYDGTVFHRVIDQFVIQGGDVQDLNGIGGPGYNFTGAYGPEDGYLVGSLAMANRGAPNSNGSQFFIVTGPSGAALDPNYSLMGHVVTGLDVALAIQKVETDSADLPVKPVSISSITISEATSSQIDLYKDLTD